MLLKVYSKSLETDSRFVHNSLNIWHMILIIGQVGAIVKYLILVGNKIEKI